MRYHVKDLAGKPAVFKIKLLDVCVRQLPALNSDFAKRWARWTPWRSSASRSASSCMTASRQRLNHAKDQVLASWPAAAEGELPSVLVEHLPAGDAERPAAASDAALSLNRYLSQIHETRESFTANVHAGAEKNTRPDGSAADRTAGKPGAHRRGDRQDDLRSG